MTGRQRITAVFRHRGAGTTGWPTPQETNLSDAVGTAPRRAASILAGHCVVIDPPAGLPMLALDMVLFEQILFDFLDNAARQALDGTVITVAMHVGGETVVLRIMDESVDIPPAGVERSFEKFPRATEDRRRAGTGLAIGRDAAMGGTVTAANRAGRLWAATIIALPVPVRAPQPEQASIA